MSSKRAEHADVVIVGAGNAALCAALAAKDAGANPVVLETAPKTERGGNTYFVAGSSRWVFNDIDEIQEVMDLTEEELGSLSRPEFTEFVDSYRSARGVFVAGLQRLLAED